MPNDEKVSVYIDGSNLYHTLRNTTAREVAKLVGSRRLVRAYYYNAPVDQEPDRYRS